MYVFAVTVEDTCMHCSIYPCTTDTLVSHSIEELIYYFSDICCTTVVRLCGQSCGQSCIYINLVENVNNICGNYLLWNAKLT